MTKGYLITFSGLDGAGKSTQIKLLLDHLYHVGKTPVYLWSRLGYTPAFSAAKKFIRSLSSNRAIPPAGHSPERTVAFSKPGIRRLWLVVGLLDLMLVYACKVRWLKWRGKTILCDRYVWDSLIDLRLHFSNERAWDWWLWRAVVRLAPVPDAAFLLLVPVEESVRRSDIKGEPYRDGPVILAQRLAEYQQLAQDGHWHVIDGCKSIAQMEAEVLAALSQAIQLKINYSDNGLTRNELKPEDTQL